MKAILGIIILSILAMGFFLNQPQLETKITNEGIVEDSVIVQMYNFTTGKLEDTQITEGMSYRDYTPHELRALYDELISNGFSHVDTAILILDVWKEIQLGNEVESIEIDGEKFKI